MWKWISVYVFLEHEPSLCQHTEADYFSPCAAALQEHEHAAYTGVPNKVNSINSHSLVF